VPGLRNINLNWEKSDVKAIVAMMQAKYDEIEESHNRLGTEKSLTTTGAVSEAKPAEDNISNFYTPYQFTLPILQSLYLLFEPNEDSRLKVSLEDIRKAVLKATNPSPREGAMTTALRAIAYLSWEPESRLFLIRRVYPTFFDFLSVSHIPEGWGVSSKILDSLKDELDQIERARLERKRLPKIVNGSFFETVDVEAPDNRSRMLPYLAEQHRLNYKHVFILPVFRPDTVTSDRDMLGTFLFFIGDDNGLFEKRSKEESTLRLFANDLCPDMARLIEAHNRVLAGEPLSEYWRREAGKDQRHKVCIAEVELSCIDHNHDKTCDSLESAARAFLMALTKPDYFAIRDSSQEKRQDKAIFLVTARHGIKGDEFKKRLLRIVTESLSGEKVLCRVTIVGRPPTDPAFHLKAEHKWDV
jgi:hypothetical protein